MIKTFALRESGKIAVLLTDHQAELAHQHQGLKQYATTLGCDLNNAMRLVRDLIDPEMYGHAVSAEVRDRARQVLGVAPCETVSKASESFNHDAAWRDALGVKP